jgi:hypothetical protein
MSNPRRIVALAFGLSLIMPAAARAEPGPEVPPPAQWPDDPVASEPAAPAPAAEPTAAPAPAPAPAPVEVRTALPPKPAFSGRGLLIAAYAVTGFSWVSRFVAMGTALSFANDCSADDCSGSGLLVSGVFTYLAPIAQTAATGLVIPGGILKGRTDGHGFVTSGAPNRNGRALLIAGAVLFGVFTATSIALRPAVLVGCSNHVVGCGSTGAYVGYMLGVQASDTLSTAGAGMMSYGIAYQNTKRTYGTKVALGPWSSRGAYGVSLTGRF